MQGGGKYWRGGGGVEDSVKSFGEGENGWNESNCSSYYLGAGFDN